MKKILKNEAVQSLLTSLICIVVGMLVGFIVLLLIEPSGAFEAIVAVAQNFLGYSRANTQIKHLGTTLVKTAPLIMCSLSVLFSYKVGLFNIGAAGQYVVGACACIYAGLGLGWGWLPCMLFAAVAGAIFGMITGALKAYFNVNEVISGIMKYLPEGPQFYDEDVVTDQPERQIVAELIREKILRLMDAEIPHGIAVSIDSMKMRRHGHMMDIHATIVCERDSHKGMIIGKQGSMLRQIGQNSRIEIQNLLDKKVNLQLWVKVKKDWRDSDFLIKNFGYDRNDY